jgi:hypothetical protein
LGGDGTRLGAGREQETRAEQVTARHGVRTDGWVRAAKWFTLAATYVMNTWAAYAAGSPALVVLHSVPPLIVFVAAEAVTDLRDKLGKATAMASAEATAVEGTVVPTSPVRRTSFAEYLVIARSARTSEVAVTPMWVREVTGCSRGLSSKLAAALKAES